MANLFGIDIPLEFDITSWLSNTWIWIAIVSFIGLVAIITIVLIIFFMTYKRKIIIFEEVNHELVPVLTTRARVIRLRAGGEEVMRTLVGGYYVSAYSKRIGKSSYWFMRGTDGYLYNFVLDKFGKPIFVSGDMRMFNIAIDRLSEQTYGKSPWYEKYAVHMILFVFLIVMILGAWFIVSEIGKATKPIADATVAQIELAKTNELVISKLDGILRTMGYLEELKGVNITTSSGLIPAG